MRVILLVLLVVHTACFVAIIVSLDSLTSYIKMINNCARSSYMLQRVMISARMLDNIHSGNINQGWYSATDLDNIIHDFDADIHELEEASQLVFFGPTASPKPTRLLPQFDLGSIWEESSSFLEQNYFDIAPAAFFKNGSNSLWDVTNGVIAHSKELVQNHAYISNVTNGNISNHHDWQYVLKNGVESATSGYRQSTDAGNGSLTSPRGYI